MGVTYIMLGLVGLIVVIGGSVILVKRINSPEKVKDKYARSAESKNIFVKKYKEADIEYYRGTAMRVGLVSVLFLLILAFNYSNKEKLDSNTYNIDDEEIIEQDIPVTQQVQPPPPPPPPPPPQIEVVEDEEVIEEEAMVEDLEVNMDEEVVADPVIVQVEEVEEPEPEPEEPEIFSIVEEMPEFPGGQKALLTYLASRLKYPLIAQENGIEGTVVVRFVIDETGGLSNMEIVRNLGGGCGAEAVRVIENMPKWNPGRQRGRPVSVWFTLPVRFRLD